MLEKSAGKDSGQKVAKAAAFFDKARKARDVAKSKNFDYAIDMYLEGLRCSPDALDEGHMELHELALLRQVKGGKKPSIVEKVKLLQGRTALERMLNAEYLFAKDPDNLQYAEAILKAAVASGFKKTANWIADLLFQANSASEKPSLQRYLLLKDSYEAIGLLDRAVVACRFALGLKPKDDDLDREHRRLSAELTVSKGKYDREGDFTQSIKDREIQERMQSQDSVIKTEDYSLSAIEHARRAIEAESDLPSNIFNLAQALSDLQDEQAEHEAIDLLEDAYESKSDFSFKQRAGQIKIKQLRRKIRDAETVLETNPDDENARYEAENLKAQLDSFELEHYRQCVKNYPTDLHAKYEYAIRLLRNQQYDDAIPLFQEARREPRHKISAMSKTGLCFFLKGWFTDAVDIFKNAIASHEIKDDNITKELQYNLARSYEELDDTKKALDIYRKIAQFDYTYKDIRQRIEQLRKKKQEPTSQ